MASTLHSTQEQQIDKHISTLEDIGRQCRAHIDVCTRASTAAVKLCDYINITISELRITKSTIKPAQREALSRTQHTKVHNEQDGLATIVRDRIDAYTQNTMDAATRGITGFKRDRMSEADLTATGRASSRAGPSSQDIEAAQTQRIPGPPPPKVLTCNITVPEYLQTFTETVKKLINASTNIQIKDDTPADICFFVAIEDKDRTIGSIDNDMYLQAQERNKNIFIIIIAFTENTQIDDVDYTQNVNRTYEHRKYRGAGIMRISQSSRDTVRQSVNQTIIDRINNVTKAIQAQTSLEHARDIARKSRPSIKPIQIYLECKDRVRKNMEDKLREIKPSIRFVNNVQADSDIAIVVLKQTESDALLGFIRRANYQRPLINKRIGVMIICDKTTPTSVVDEDRFEQEGTYKAHIYDAGASDAYKMRERIELTQMLQVPVAQ